jgi:hypothetical protein
VSAQYGGRDETCPVSTAGRRGGGGGGATGVRSMAESAATPPSVPPKARALTSCASTAKAMTHATSSRQSADEICARRVRLVRGEGRGVSD